MTDRDASVVDATEDAIAAAKHLTPMDAGALAALRALARKIDTDGDVRDAILDQAAERGGDVKPPQLDNVSIPTYLKFCESLGLTPAGRVKLGETKGPQGGKLAQLRAVSGGQQQAARRRSSAG